MVSNWQYMFFTFFKSTHLHLPQCFSHMDVLAYTWLHGSREHNKICADVDTYMGVTLSELLVYSCLVFVVVSCWTTYRLFLHKQLLSTAYTMKLSKSATSCIYKSERRL